MSVFVLEIGTEELPARFLNGLEKDLRQKFSSALDSAHLDYGEITVRSTPRRAVTYITDVAPKTRESVAVVTGPPVRAAFDASGKPAKAGEGFARTQGVDFADTFKISTDKGEYLAARVKSGGEEAMAIFTRLCPEIVSGLNFSKRMRWGSGEFTFARPLRWLLALLDDKPVPFQVGEVASGRKSYGHRVHGYGPFELGSACGYFEMAREKLHIVSSGLERGERIKKGGDALASMAGGKVLWKESLLHEVQGLCEHPVPLLGRFDESFLEVPREVLLTSMEHHQKSFGLEDAAGKLLPHFLTVLNISPKDEAMVRKGWERVLRARLEDARFFWHTDLNGTFEAWQARLDKVIFLAGIGSMGDKTRRISALSRWIALKDGGVDAKDAERAGLLSKADLVTEMVGEFDTLQGIMGSIYAARKGENETVSAALAEQYLPAGPNSPLPSTRCGAIISLADKADTLAGCFGLGLAPTGAADPYALRRAALGIARIIVEQKLRLDVNELFAKAQSLYAGPKWTLQPAEALLKLGEFFALRLKNYFTGLGAETLLAESVVSAGYADVWAAFARLEALKNFSLSPDFTSAVLTFKRPANIIRKQGEAGLDGKYDEALLHEEAEKQLAATLNKLLPKFADSFKDDNFSALFGHLHELKPLVDRFFNEIMVMCEDENLRRNRLNLLYALVEQLRSLTDFDALQV